jgi:hypothetical protein
LKKTPPPKPIDDSVILVGADSNPADVTLIRVKKDPSPLPTVGLTPEKWGAPVQPTEFPVSWASIMDQGPKVLFAQDPEGRTFIYHKNRKIAIYDSSHAFVENWAPEDAKKKPLNMVDLKPEDNTDDQEVTESDATPLGLGFDRQGTRYLLCFNGQFILYQYNPRGKYLREYLLTEKNTIQRFESMAVGPDGSFCLLDKRNREVWVYGPKGKLAWKAKQKPPIFNKTLRFTAVTIDPMGRIGIVDRNYLRLFSPRGEALAAYSIFNPKDHGYVTLEAAAIEGDGRIMVDYREWNEGDLGAAFWDSLRCFSADGRFLGACNGFTTFLLENSGKALVLVSDKKENDVFSYEFPRPTQPTTP